MYSAINGQFFGMLKNLMETEQRGVAIAIFVFLLMPENENNLFQQNISLGTCKIKHLRLQTS